MFFPRRILITGASGFVGGHLVPMLRSTFPDAELWSQPFDLTDAAAVDAAVRSAAPDICVHLAAVAAIAAAQREPAHAWAVNLHGTLNLARAVLRHFPGCHFVHVSSGDIYGLSFERGEALEESALPAPLNEYSATKAAADLAVGTLACQGLRAVRLRPFTHTGPGQSADFVVPAFARQVARIAAHQQPAVMQVGALDPLRDFLDVRDVCRAYVACIQHVEELAPGQIINIASGMPRRIGDILAELIALSGVECRVETDPSRLRRRDIPSASGNAALARRLLGWSPSIPWATTLADTLQDWRARSATGGTA